MSMTDLNISLSDIQDILSEPTKRNSPNDLSIKSGGDAYDQYSQPGSFIRADIIDLYANKILNEAYKHMGQGSRDNILQNFLSRIDRHGTAIIPLNSLNYGYTFITRPRLNLLSANLRQHPVMNTLISEDPNGIPFMIRALLDTRLHRGLPVYGTTLDQETYNFSNLAIKSGLLDGYNPFMIPMMNGLKGMSGFPDFTLETETTEGDFHSGDFTFAKGSDMNNRTQELSLEFRDSQGSVIMATIFYWLMTMALQAKGIMVPYADDIYEQRLNYTVSIYRFVTDPTRRNILWWAKATGCFPKSVPVGALFNIAHEEVTLSSAMHFSIPFTANDIKVNDPGILLDFNTLMTRYCPNIRNSSTWVDVDTASSYNFIGLPFIETTRRGLELKWKTSNYYSDVLSPDDPTWDELQQAAETSRDLELQAMLEQVQPTEQTTST